jgi:periplasmic divalent cation tolerance protein
MYQDGGSLGQADQKATMNIIIFITVANKKEARQIANTLVKEKLVACVNIIDSVESVFLWNKKIEKARELLLIAKSKQSNFLKIIRLTKSLHSYQVPEIISFPIAQGYKPYLRWLNESLR